VARRGDGHGPDGAGASSLRRHRAARALGALRCRTPAIYRDDLGRLYTIRALRHLGLPLAEIARVLIDDPDPREIVRGQLDLLEQSITAAQRLRRGLRGLLATLDAVTQPSVYTLTELIKGMISMESRLTPEQLRELTEGRRRMTEQLTDFAAMTQQRQTTMAQLPADELAAMTRRRSALTGPMDERPRDRRRGSGRRRRLGARPAAHLSYLPEVGQSLSSFGDGTRLRSSTSTPTPARSVSAETFSSRRSCRTAISTRRSRRWPGWPRRAST